MGTKFSINPEAVMHSAMRMHVASQQLNKMATGTEQVMAELDPSLRIVVPSLEMVAKGIRDESKNMEKLGVGQEKIARTYRDYDNKILAAIHVNLEAADGGSGGSGKDDNSDDSDSTTAGETELTEEQKAMVEKMKAAYGNEDPLDLDGSKRVVHKNDWLEWAIAQAGFTEGKNEEGKWGNKTPFGVFTGADNQPWCASFVSWCLFMAGDTTLKPTCRTIDMMRDADAKGLYRDFSKAETANYVPKPGDIFYKRNDPNNPNDESGHVGFISSVEQNPDGSVTIKTIEGNSGQQVKSRTFSSMDAFKQEFSGVIEMNREGKTSYSNNMEVPPVKETGSNGTR